MPWGDGTGPWWAHGRWYCWRRGFGYRFGWRWLPLSLSREDELRELELEKKELERELEYIKKRLEELKK